MWFKNKNWLLLVEGEWENKFFKIILGIDIRVRFCEILEMRVGRRIFIFNEKIFSDGLVFDFIFKVFFFFNYEMEMGGREVLMLDYGCKIYIRKIFF